MIRNYADGFSLSYAEDKSEFLINFTQVEPTVDENGEVLTEKVDVAKLKFNKEVAENIYKALMNIFACIPV